MMSSCPPGSGGGCGAPVVTQTLFVGDVKPLSYNVTPNDLHVIGSATYDVLDVNGVSFASGQFAVTYPAGPYTDPANPPTSNLQAGAITWSEVGEFVVRIVITWDDGQIDHSVWGLVEVYPLPTVGGC
jgi:hypothetical protein